MNSDQIYETLKECPIPKIPRSLNVRSVLKEMKAFRDTVDMTDKNVAAHACFWTPCNVKNKFGQYNAKIMMHLRFDGTFGFPGGFIDAGDPNLILGLTRELTEEVNYSVVRQREITPNDYHSTRVQDNCIHHFFVIKLTNQQYQELEKNALSAKEFGVEVMGSVQVPLYTMDNNFGGLPAFINNKFVGSSKQQLLMAMFSIGVLTDKDLDELIHNANNMKLAPSRM